MDTEEKIAHLERRIENQEEAIEDLLEINALALAMCETLASGLEHVLHGADRREFLKHCEVVAEDGIVIIDEPTGRDFH